jgi:uncharacterized protein YjbI with pentapeptide repeats
LSNCSAIDSVFDGSDLSYAKLFNANLRGSEFYRTTLFKSDLRSANLTSADLEHAYLVGSKLSRSNLTDANLFCASLWGGGNPRNPFWILSLIFMRIGLAKAIKVRTKMPNGTVWGDTKVA